MNRLQRVLVKALGISYPRTLSSWLPDRPIGTSIQYGSRVGDGSKSSIVMACVNWVTRTFPEAPLMVMKRVNDDWEDVPEHPLMELLERPNPFYSGPLLWMGTLADWTLTGNAFWIKVRNRSKGVAELWWVPSSLIAPKWPNDGSAFLTHYEYRPQGAPIRLEPADVVHFRYGIDPQNMRKGLSPLGALLREIWTDEEASNYTASLLRNMGVPGVIISPDTGGTVSEEDAKETKKWFQDSFTGDKRGEALVMSGPTKVQTFGFSPDQMKIGDLRDIPEERVCAVLGIPAAVVGLGTGMQQTKVGATMAELRQQAYSDNIIPTQRLMAAELKTQLLPEFEESSEWGLRFDMSSVRAMQEDENKLALRHDTMVRGGWETVGEARRALGLPTDESHDIYLRSFAMIEVPIGSEPRPMLEPEEPKVLKAARMSQAQRQLVLALRRDERRLGTVFSGRMSELFTDLGRQAAAAFLDIAAVPATIRASTNGHEQKDDPVRAVLSRLAVTRFVSSKIKPTYEGHYRLTADVTFETMNGVMALGAEITDAVAQRVLALGGRRVGLLDLEGDTRRAMFQALADGEAAGEGIRDLSKRVQQYVGAGPWSDAKMRAEIISRTETRYAQLTSIAEAAESSGVVRGYLVLDAQLGPTDEECEDLAGQEVGLDEGRALRDSEHPNGTRLLVPLVR